MSASHPKVARKSVKSSSPRPLSDHPTNATAISTSITDRLENSSLSLALPIEKHYSVNTRNLILFEESFKRGFYAIAYQYGKQFVETALIEIPKHGYFNSSRHVRDKEKCSLETWRVTKILETMLGPMEQQSLQNPLQAIFGGPSKEDEANEDQREAVAAAVTSIGLNKEEKIKERKEINNLRKIFEKEYGKKSVREKNGDDDDEIYVHVVSEENRDEDTLWSEWTEIKSEMGNMCLSDNSIDVGALKTDQKLYPDVDHTSSMLPFPMTASSSFHVQPVVELLPPSPDNRSESGGNGRPSTKNNPKTTLPIQTLTQCFMEDFQSLLNAGEVNIYHFLTYQGKKNKNGINGCTVIASLVVVHHFSLNQNSGQDSDDDTATTATSNNQKHYNGVDEDVVIIQNQKKTNMANRRLQLSSSVKNSSSSLTVVNSNNDDEGPKPQYQPPSLESFHDSFLSDLEIEEIINVKAPAILPEVRNNLGLTKDALIIPSDVHDYLLSQDLLSQEQFVGVCGGNVLDRRHFGKLITTLVDNYEEIKSSVSTQQQPKQEIEEKYIVKKSKIGIPSFLPAVGRKNRNKKKEKAHYSNNSTETSKTKSTTGQKSSCNHKNLSLKLNRLAATLYFHGHVICILKIRRPDGKCWFDIIDSLPKAKTLQQSGSGHTQEQTQNSNGSPLPDLQGTAAIETAIAAPLHNRRSGHFATTAPTQEHKKERRSFTGNIMDFATYRRCIQEEKDEEIARMIMLQEEKELDHLIDGGDPSQTDSVVAMQMEYDVQQQPPPSLSPSMSHTHHRGTVVVDERFGYFGENHHSMDVEVAEPQHVDFIDDISEPLNAVRIRCKGIKSLEATLQWYCCSRFTEDDMKYIDEYEWDERNSDIDPRVFQSFVWTGV